MELNKKYEINDVFRTKESFLESINDFSNVYFSRKIEDTNNIQKYIILSKLINTCSNDRWRQSIQKTRSEHVKQVYFLSMEYLYGKMLSHNLKSLGIYEVVKEGLKDISTDINELENIESDISLGDSNQGKLLANYLDSLSCLEYPGSASTIRYKNGYFKQAIIKNEQVELPDQWLNIDNPWEKRRADKAIDVRFYGHIDITRDSEGKIEYHRKNTEHILAVPYDLPIYGTNLCHVNTLRMWSAESSDDLPEGKDYREYIRDVEDLCSHYHPINSTEDEVKIRIKQQYFLVSASLQSIVNEHMRVYGNVDNLPEKVSIQLSDTSTALAIPELMRILIDTYHKTWERAWDITTKTFTFVVNSTLQSEFETIPVQYIKTIIPRIYLLIRGIDKMFNVELRRNGYDDNFIKTVSILNDEKARMAHMCIYGSSTTVSISKHHSELLISKLFSNFYKLFPRRFISKTAGISQRNWLFNINNELCAVLDKYIGNDYKKYMKKISFLEDYVNKPDTRHEFMNVKNVNKDIFGRWLKNNNKISVDSDTVFDVMATQIKPNKRQLLALFYVMSLFFKIKDERVFSKQKTTFIFAGKASPSDEYSKNVIKLINCVANTVNNDPEASQYIRVVYIPNFNTSAEEKLVPAADIVEEISTVGSDAGDITNMKYMMNGAITIGTNNGTNIEIRKMVGESCVVIFGPREDNSSSKLLKGNVAYELYRSNSSLHRIIDSLIDGTWSTNTDDFKLLYEELLINNDEYMVLTDFDEYVKAHDKAYSFYTQKDTWVQKYLVNIAKSAFFSSDRIIKEFALDIWKLTSFKKETF